MQTMSVHCIALLSIINIIIMFITDVIHVAMTTYTYIVVMS